jgi:hypothetical protein
LRHRRGGFEALMTRHPLPQISPYRPSQLLRSQSVDVPPDDLIARASFLFELSASEQYDLTAMAVQ